MKLQIQPQKMNLDLIIPVYNNRKGVISSILSMGDLSPIEKEWNINIIIVDDCSTLDTYQDLPELFKSFYNITLLKTPQNMGPGGARQLAIDSSHSDYFMFLDAGDLLISSITFFHYLSIVKNNPHIYLFSAAKEETYADYTVEYVGPSHNRIHGKIYNTNFIKSHNIVFPKGLPSLNEDIGYNSCCRLICQHLSSLDNIDHILEYDSCLISWTYDEKSITRKNNYEFNTLQNKGLGPHMIHAFKIAKQNGVSDRAIEKRGYESFLYQFLFYYEALYTQRNIQENLEGCLYFYEHFFVPMKEMDQTLFTEVYNLTMSEIYSEATHTYTKNIPTFGIVDFLNILEQQYRLKLQERNNGIN